MIKIATIIGARPQFIKAAAVSRRIKADSRFSEMIIHTGQHFDYGMSEIFFKELDIPEPDYNLGINSLSHGAMTGEMLIRIEKILLKENPDYILVYGDTNSTLAGALAAKKLLIPVIHVEAGLRSFNITMPEETNRILTDRMSSLLFCPTDTSVENLRNEGFDHFENKIFRIGDIMYDTFLYMQKILQNKERSGISEEYALTTIHRAENTDNPARLQSIVSALTDISGKIEIILPLHPRTKAILNKNVCFKSFLKNDKIKIIEPVGYKKMVELLLNSSIILTDSGGLQKDAYFAKKPCLTLRDETEWVELVKAGYNKVVSADKKLIIDSFNDFWQNRKIISFKPGLYGDGKAAIKILDEVFSFKK